MRKYVKLVFLFVGSLVVGMNINTTNVLAGWEEKICLFMLIFISISVLVLWRNQYVPDLVEILAGLPAGVIISRQFNISITALLTVDTIMVIITLAMVIIWGNNRQTQKKQ